MIEFMDTTDMAVVVSQAQNEVADMAGKGLDIAWHRQRMIHEDLETKLKDPDDPFRIVFVCAMWMTGFDVPSCSTIYLDKPMREPHPHADHRPSQPGEAGQDERAHRRLRGCVPGPPAGAGHLRVRGWRSGQGRARCQSCQRLN